MSNTSKNIMRDDESFEKYVMGNPNVHGDAHESKHIPASKHPEVLNNHHASGRTKAKANQASKDEMEEIHLQKT
ncbi:hypothetical protein BKA70DRAFT_1424313 [Coprinopsis sp. MPI-PUGE-AT-0042]|nr:hypothetical protein BKA70DRAFT_1424313 [Coprinopsis sp. MPI-PUGE-AT-0042]